MLIRAKTFFITHTSIATLYAVADLIVPDYEAFAIIIMREKGG